MKHASLAVMCDVNGRYLLQKRDSHAPKNPKKWALFGGGAEENESPKETLVRELQEELKLIVDPFKLNHICTIESKTSDEQRYYYFVDQKIEEESLSLQEGESFAFFTLEESRAIDLVQEVFEIIRLHAGK